MQLAYATSFNSEDIRNWSGLGVYYAKMLRDAGFQHLNRLDVIEKPIINSAIHFFKNKISSRLLPKTPSSIFTLQQSKTYAKIIDDKIGNGTHLLSPNTVILGHVKKDVKKILYTDSTLENLLNFYSNYCNLPEEAVLEAQQLEQLTIERSDLLIYTSQWAADSAINDYNADAGKVFTVPFGANLQLIPDDQEVSSIVAKRKITKHIRLLLIGVDWERKGGRYAVQVAEELNRLEIPVTLHIVGMKDIPEKLHKKFIVDHGFISKRNLKQEMKLYKLVAESDFVILPSLADCTPVVFSEANAFGVPCLTTQVGGHTSIIKDGINGKAWARQDFVESCVKYISELVESEKRYQELCLSARNVYLKELNWKTTGAKIAGLIRSI